MKRKKPKYCAFSENKVPKHKDMMAKTSPDHAHTPVPAHNIEAHKAFNDER